MPDSNVNDQDRNKGRTIVMNAVVPPDAEFTEDKFAGDFLQAIGQGQRKTPQTKIVKGPSETE